MKTPKKPLTPELSAEWAQRAQLFVLDSLMAESAWSAGQMAFHGGTSLHLSWRSPRFSEDLDFLIDRQVADIDQVMGRVAKRLEERFVVEDPRFRIEVKNKTRDGDRMPVFHVAIEHEGFHGKSMVKTEFWRVDAAYLAQYPSTFKTPITPGEVVSRVLHPVPAAELKTAFCDKLTAFATRPFLKWRDVYDIWWIGTQTDAALPMPEVLAQFAHNLSAYNTPGGMPAPDALRRFLDYDRAEVIAKADPDLRRWLPPSLWERLKGEGVAEMVDYARGVIEVVARAIDAPAADVPELPRTLAASLRQAKEAADGAPGSAIGAPRP